MAGPSFRLRRLNHTVTVAASSGLTCAKLEVALVKKHAKQRYHEKVDGRSCNFNMSTTCGGQYLAVSIWRELCMLEDR